MTIDDIFNIAVVIFTVGNLAAMGLELNVSEAIQALRNWRFVVLTIIWSWLVGPGLAFLLVQILPISEAYGMGLLLASPAPCAPFYPLVVRKAHGNVAFAAAFLLLTAFGTVLIMPIVGAVVGQGDFGQCLGNRKTIDRASTDPNVGRNLTARLFSDHSRQALSRSQTNRGFCHTSRAYPGTGALRQGHAELDGRLCCRSTVFVSRRNDSVVVQDRSGVGKEREKRHGSGHRHSQYRSGFRRAHGHSESRP